MDILVRFLIAVLVCIGISIVAWGIDAILGLIPMLPQFMKSVLRILIVGVAGGVCILIIVSALSGPHMTVSF